MVISSIVEGRVRIRDEELKNASIVEPVREALLTNPAIKEVSANRRVGSLLIVYDKAATAVKNILNILSEFFGLAEDNPDPAISAPPPSKAPKAKISLPQLFLSKRAVVNLGMLASLVASLGGAVLGSMELHIIAGLIFVGICAFHLFDKRRPLFA